MLKFLLLHMLAWHRQWNVPADPKAWAYWVIAESTDNPEAMETAVLQIFQQLSVPTLILMGEHLLYQSLMPCQYGAPAWALFMLGDKAGVVILL